MNSTTYSKRVITITDKLLREFPMIARCMIMMGLFSADDGKATYSDKPKTLGQINGVSVMLAGMRLTLKHLQIIEAIMATAVKKHYHPERGMVVLFKPSEVLKKIRGGRNRSGNYGWLDEMLGQMQHATIRIGELAKGPNAPRETVLTKYGKYEDESSGTYTANVYDYEQVLDHDGRAVTQRVYKGSERRDSCYWFATFSPSFLAFYEIEWGFRYDRALDDLNSLRHAISGLLARHVIINEWTNHDLRPLIIQYMGLDPEQVKIRDSKDYNRLKIGIRWVREDAEGMAKLGAHLVKDEQTGVWKLKGKKPDWSYFYRPGRWQAAWLPSQGEEQITDVEPLPA